MRPIDRTKIITKFQNQWVAMTEDDSVVSSGPILEQVLERARRKGVVNPVIAKIPPPKYNHIS